MSLYHATTKTRHTFFTCLDVSCTSKGGVLPKVVFADSLALAVYCVSRCHASACFLGCHSRYMGMSPYVANQNTAYLLHAFDVSHTRLYFPRLRHLTELASDAGIDTRDMLRVVQAKGAGYALSNQQELETIQHVAQTTGVVLPAVMADVMGAHTAHGHCYAQFHWTLQSYSTASCQCTAHALVGQHHFAH